MKKSILSFLLVMATVAGQAKAKTVVWEHPATDENEMIDGFFSTLLEITRVELADDETRVMMHVAHRKENWLRFASDTYLKADGKRYALKRCDGLELDTEVYLTDHDRADLVFHFEPLPAGTRRFDFIEGDVEGAFKLLGVEDAGTRAARLFPSNWRSTLSGDWAIGFYDDFAIYDCKFWNYKQRRQKGDRYTLVLENGGSEVVVSVDRNKDGRRTMTIGGTKGEYEYISSVALPDYPVKDSRTTFTDTHYATDTVTLVGWLKNMPQQLKERGNEFRVTVTNIFYLVEPEPYYGKIDSLGRFTVKVPLLNSAEMFFDWDRTHIRTLFEPGETYFLLYDYKGGHKLFMGRNCRLQNETLACPIRWVTGQPEADADEAAIMRFLEHMKAEKADAMAELERTVAARPNLSARYINYLTADYNIDEGRELMQGKHCLKGGLALPKAYLDYVGRQHWQQLPRPYTLYREESLFLRDYMRQIIDNRYAVKGPRFTFTTYGDVEVETLRRYRAAGQLQISDEELDVVHRHDEAMKNILASETDEAQRQALAEFEQSEIHRQYTAIAEREDVKKILADEMPLLPVYQMLHVMDSLNCDQDLRDILITDNLNNQLAYSRQPLTGRAMQFFEENVCMPAAKAFLQGEQEKYLAVQQRNFSDKTSLKSVSDVADMSEGGQILGKIIEPYRGRLILLDVWGTWCGPCKDALAKSKEEYERLKDFDLVYLYLANRSSDEAWKAVIKQYDLTGPNIVHYNLPTDQQSAVEHFLGVTSYPSYRIIDREGRVLDVNADPRNLNALTQLLEQIAN